MNEKTAKPAETTADKKQRAPIFKWVFLLAAVFFSFASLVVQRGYDGTMSGNSAGAAAAGLWIAFAMLHVGEQKQSEPKPASR